MISKYGRMIIIIGNLQYTIRRKNMFKKIKEYFMYLKAKREISLLILNQYSDFLLSEIEKNESELEAINTVNSLNSSVSPDELKSFISTFNEFSDSMKNPKINEEFFNNIIKLVQQENKASESNGE